MSDVRVFAGSMVERLVGSDAWKSATKKPAREYTGDLPLVVGANGSVGLDPEYDAGLESAYA